MAILEERVEMFLVFLKFRWIVNLDFFPFECDIVVITGIGTGAGATGVGG